MNIFKNNAGFTLVEIMVTMTILLIIFGAVGAAFSSGIISLSRGSDNIELQQKTRYVVESITKEIRGSYYTIIEGEALYILLNDTVDPEGVKSFKYKKSNSNLVRDTAKMSEDEVENWLENPEEFSYSGSNVIAYNVTVFEISQNESLITLQIELTGPEGYVFSLTTKSSPRGVL